MSKDKLNEEARKMMALAGIQESDKKFLNNESFSEPDSETLHPSLSKNDANPGDWKGMDSMDMGTTFQEPIQKFDSPQAELEESEGDSDANFIVSEFDQIDVEPGEDDDKLYKLG